MTAQTTARWQRFLAELKRRQVFRVTAVYGATAFVVIQAADLIFPRLRLPDWTVTLIVAAALVGLPIALVLAWVFETGSDGVRRTTPAAQGELDAILAQSRARRWPAGIAAAVGILLLGGGVWLAVGAGGKSYDSIAVLPFNNLSGEPENEYFGDGLAEELINALTGIEGLRVAARTSAFAFKGKDVDIRVIGDTLNVATVLEGSVRRSEGRLRITAQLIDARTGFHLWSDTYDRPMAELFSVQEAIASEIVDKLVPTLSGVERSELYRGGTKDVEAYDLYLLGRQKWVERDIPLLREAVTHFEAAIARDSSFALAWSGLADALDALAYRSTADQVRVAEAKYAAQRAILLDPEMAEGWASLGVLAGDFDWDWRFAELALRRAIALKPGYEVAHRWLADVLRYTGRIDEALQFSRRALQLDPIGGVALMGHAEVLLVLGRFAESREVYLRAYGSGKSQTSMVNMATYARNLGFSADEAARYASDWAENAGYARPHEAAVLGRAVLAAGSRTEARAVIRRMEAAGLPLRGLALISAAITDYERAIELLERSVEHKEGINAVGVHPLFDPVRKDPRFIAILKQLGVPNCDAACRAVAAAPVAKLDG